MGDPKAEKLFSKTTAGAVIVTALMVTIIMLAYSVYRTFEETVISQTQQQLLITARTSAISLEEHIGEHLSNLRFISENPLFQKQIQNHDALKTLFNAHKEDVDAVYLLNSNGIVLFRFPPKKTKKAEKDPTPLDYSDRPGVAYVLKEGRPHVSEVFRSGSGIPSISLIEPIFHEGRLSGMVRVLVTLDTISERFIQPIKAGLKGYGQLLDDSGQVLAHPMADHVGNLIMAARRKAFPNHDWSDLERIVEKMTRGESGVGLYRSAWWTEQDPEIVRKITAYAPVHIGDGLWSIGVTMGYADIAGPIRRLGMEIAGFTMLLVLILGFGSVILYRNYRKKESLETESRHLREIADSNEALRINAERYRTLIQNVNDPVLIAQDEVAKFSNPKYQQMLGYSGDELATISLFDVIHPDDRDLVLERYQARLRGETAANIYEYRLITRTGEEVLVELNAVPITWEDRPASLCVLRDITQQRRIEERLQRTMQLESIGILAGGIAHDFNNLLSVILGNLSMARDDMKGESKGADYLQEAEAASLRAKELTTRLITFSKGGDPVKRAMAIDMLIREAVQSALDGSVVTCEMSAPDDLFPVEIDDSQMKQVINDIAVNAHEAMDGKGVVRVHCENVTIADKDPLQIEAGKYVRISIQDQGKGISEADLAKIFDPYFSTKERGTEKGMGLGLSVCHSIVERHKGRITVESEKGVGTTFHLYLPASEKTIAEPEPPQKALLKEPISGSGRLLVMDDEEMIRVLAFKRLSRLGYDVEVAGDGAEAIEQYRKAMDSGKPFDVVILDL
ncbi:MAG: ATP-binding protein, partial [Desulfobacterales bacterium]